MLHPFILLASMIATVATEQCCDHGIAVEQDSVSCVGMDQKIGFEGCHQDIQVVDLKHTSNTSYGGQLYKTFILPNKCIWHQNP